MNGCPCDHIVLPRCQGGVNPKIRPCVQAYFKRVQQLEAGGSQEADRGLSLYISTGFDDILALKGIS
jgi:hypothetical protein